jgi:hypothetical protein
MQMLLWRNNIEAGHTPNPSNFNFTPSKIKFNAQGLLKG